MSNGSKEVIFRDLRTGRHTISGTQAEFQLRCIKVDVLEMEDVLFHHNSAVMMPSAPAGKSSTQGTGDNPEDAGDRTAQDRISGIEALGVVFRQFEFDDNKRLLVTAHTDTSGKPEYNFELSDLRALNVLRLLDGGREQWAEICRDKHKVEDYQQIMTFLSASARWNWACDPLGIDDSWGPNTKDATSQFITHYNDWLDKNKFAEADYPRLPTDYADKIDKDPKHIWPIEMWRAVFDLYNMELANSLGIDTAGLDKDYRSLLQFVVDRGREFKHLACGESFPIDSSERSNYRSQTNRRVELLFFDRKEIPYIDCPARVTSIHQPHECPIWHKQHFVPAYINPEDLKLTAYHLRFIFYDPLGDAFLKAPEGLKIQVIENGTTQIKSRTTFAGGVYTVKIRDNPSRTSLDFAFDTVNQWIDFTDSANPKIVTKTLEEMARMHFSDRIKFYDLPEKWHSKNWIVSRGGNWVKFADTVKNKTGASDSIDIYLDCCVMLSESLSPENITDSDRLTVFDVRCQIQNQDPDKGYLTKGSVKQNFLTPEFTIRPARIIAWKSVFYDATVRRLKTGNYIGARAAVKNDRDMHFGAAIQKPATPICGNFELHYFKECLDPDKKAVDGLMVFWSCRFAKDSDVTAADEANFHKTGFAHSMNRWRRKKYEFKPRSDPNNRKLEVMPFFFLEGREENPYKCTVKLHKPTPDARANMGLTGGNFKTSDYQATGTAHADDGQNYAFFTMAHELGHAMGLHDEYRESIEEDKNWSPTLPTFDQWYPAMPYGFDFVSMMVTNRAPRLRHFWYWCRWVNETAETKLLTGNTVFRVEGGASKTWQYSLPQAMTNFYTPVAEETDRGNGSYGKFDLFLYKCGNDETVDRMISGHSDFDGTLVIRTKLQWFFDDHDGADWADDDVKLNYLRQFQNRIDARLNAKYYIESNDPEFKKIYVQFVPHYYFEGSTIHDHFEVEVKANNTAAIRYTAEFYEDDFDSDEFSVDQLQNEVSIMRYTLGLKPYKVVGAVKQSVNSIGAAELAFLADWVKAKRGATHNYTMKQK